MKKYLKVNPFEKASMSSMLAGRPGHWKTFVALEIQLDTHDFDGMSGDTFFVKDGSLFVEANTAWNGSSVVPDTKYCVLASLIHDLLTGMIRELSVGNFKKWKLQREADRIYATVCIRQGMWSVRAKIRYCGLRLFGGVYGMFSK